MTIGYIYASILKRITHRIKRKPNVWVFGAWSGQNYSDNSKYMFEYVNKNCKEIKAIWITRSNVVCNQVRNLGYKCYKYNSLQGQFYSIIAGVAFETAGNEDISPLIDNKLTKTIMMWHGVGGKESIWKGKHSDAMYEKGKYDYFTATSNLYIELMGNKLDRKKFAITGQARDDTFVNKPDCVKVKHLLEKYHAKKLIIYMPTHRNFGRHGNNYINVNEFSKLNEFLKERNYLMVYKPHFHELQHFLDMKVEYSNIIFAQEEFWGDPYSYLHYFDLLISDYSSCMYDFLCSGNPVILFTYDIDDYKRDDVGLDDSFWKYPIGPLCSSWDEVFTAIDESFSSDFWREKRRFCCEIFHDYNDGKNCERIYRWVLSIAKNMEI